MSVLILKEFREKYGVSREEQASMLDISIDTLNNWEYRKKEIPSSKIKNVEYVFSMYEKNLYVIEPEELQNTLQEESIIPMQSNRGVPYYDVDFYGGFDFAFNDQTIQPSFRIDYAPYNDCDAWINVTGKSMSPFISHGDIAALKKLKNWKEFIPFGEVYAVLTEEHKTIKIVTAGKNDDYLKLIPYNKGAEFVEQQIPKKLIYQMYRVKGSIKKFF